MKWQGIKEPVKSTNQTPLQSRQDEQIELMPLKSRLLCQCLGENVSLVKDCNFLILPSCTIQIEELILPPRTEKRKKKYPEVKWEIQRPIYIWWAKSAKQTMKICKFRAVNSKLNLKPSVQLKITHLKWKHYKNLKLWFESNNLQNHSKSANW